MRKLESFESGFWLLFAAAGTLLTVGPRVVVDMVVYPVVGVAAVLVAAFGWDRLDGWRRRFRRRRPLHPTMVDRCAG